MDKEVVESHQILRLHGGVEDLLSFKEFVPEEVPVLFVSATIAISKKVHLPALFGIPRAANLPPGANNSQTTPGIVGADRFPRCRFFIFRGVCRRDFRQLIDELLPLRKPIFLLFTSKELLLETSNALKFPHLAQYRNGDAANIKRRFDRGEKALFYWEQEASGRVSIFPNKKK